VRIDRDGTVTVTINRLEFGQGVQTGLPMILAEELDADWSLVKSQHGTPTRPMWTRLSACTSRAARARSRTRTRSTANSARAPAPCWWPPPRAMGVDAGSLRTQQGVVIGPGGKRLTYGELAEAAMKLPVPEAVTLKDPKQFRIIGKPTGRLDARAKSTGNQSYGIDVRLPGMLTAVVAHPPVFAGKVKSLDDSAARPCPA
jgi:isoquinoline 1-oxidoreductase beta subunit